MATLPPPTTMVRPGSASILPLLTSRKSRRPRSRPRHPRPEYRRSGRPGSRWQHKGLKTLLAQLVERHVATDLHAIAELGAHQANDLDLGLDNILLQLKAGNAVGEHTARALVFSNTTGL